MGVGPVKPRAPLRKCVSNFLESRNFDSMTKNIDDYIKDIRKALKSNNAYTSALDMQIRSLASAMRNLDMANAQIDGLEETTVWEKTRYGEKLAPHPVFKIAKEAQELITRQMKALKLTAEDLTGAVDDDPLVDITKKLAKKRKTPKILMTND